MNDQAEYRPYEDESEEDYSLTFSEIVKEIWLSPRIIFSKIEAIGYEKYLVPMMILIGIVQTFDRGTMKSAGDNLSFGMIILIGLVGGAAFGWLGVYIGAAILKWTGSWFGGTADFASIVRVSVYSSIPSLFTAGIILLQLLVWGESMFQSDVNPLAGGIGLFFLYIILAVVELVLGIWSFVIFVAGISVVQNFSIGRTLASLFVPILALIVLITLVVGIIMLAR